MGPKTRLNSGLAAALGLLLAFGAGAAAADKSPRHKHASPWSKAARMTAAERSDFDYVNADRALARVGAVSSAAVLQKIANKRVREMAARHSDYAGYDVSVDLKRAHLCFTKSMEIEDELTGGGGGDYPEIEQNPRWTVFADAILTNAVGTYTVEDYVLPCGQHPQKPVRPPKGSLKLEGLAVSVGPPGAGASLTPVRPLTTVTNPAACNASAGLYAVIDYSGIKSAHLTGRVLPGEVSIDSPVSIGRSAVLLASGPLDGNNYGFELGVSAKLKLPDGDSVPITLAETSVGAKLISVAPSC